MLSWDSDLRLAQTDWYLDARTCRQRCVISHAHTDHIACHDLSIGTSATADLVLHRIGESRFRTLQFNEDFQADPDTRIRLLPAGHVLGSAMVHVTRPEGTLLYTGDFKLRPSRTAASAEPLQADHLVMESTYGLPRFRFPAAQMVAEQLVELVGRALRNGRQPIVLAYSLGKSQEATRILTDAGFNVTLHGAPHAVARIYQRHGVRLGRFRRYAYADFHGSDALDLAERGVLIAPPHAARSAFVTRFKQPLRIALTGWALLKNAIYRYGVDQALPLSDHADFDELLELVERVRPKRIYTHHGYPQFVETLRSRGYDAVLAHPPAQMTLFE